MIMMTTDSMQVDSIMHDSCINVMKIEKLAREQKSPVMNDKN